MVDTRRLRPHRALPAAEQRRELCLVEVHVAVQREAVRAGFGWKRLLGDKPGAAPPCRPGLKSTSPCRRTRENSPGIPSELAAPERKATSCRPAAVLVLFFSFVFFSLFLPDAGNSLS